MNALSYRLTLRVWHPTKPLAALSARLGAQPDFGWNVGDPCVTPRGRALGGNRNETYWCIVIARWSSASTADEALGRHVALLKPLRRFLQTLVRTGGRIEYDVACNSEAGVGVRFAPDLLHELASMRIALGVSGFASSRQATEIET